MQFVGDFLIDGAVCDRLIELHRACDRRPRQARPNGKGGNLVVDPEKKDSFDVSVDLVPPELLNKYGIERYYAELSAACSSTWSSIRCSSKWARSGSPSRLRSSTIARAAG